MDYESENKPLSVPSEEGLHLDGLISRLKKELKRTPDDHQKLFSLGMAYAAGQKELQAITVLKRVVRLKPDFAEAHFHLGSLYSKLKLFQEADESLQKAFQLNPYLLRNEIQNNFFGCKMFKSNYGFDPGKEKAKNAPDPEENPKELETGIVYFCLGAHEKAVDHLKKGLKAHPNDAFGFFVLGEAYRNLGRMYEALGAYERATTLKEDYAEAYFSLGAVLVMLSRFDESIIVLKKGLDYSPNDFGSHLILGISYGQTGNFGEAYQILKKAAAFHPDSQVAQTAYASICFRIGKREEAKKAYKVALTLKPEPSQNDFLLLVEDTFKAGDSEQPH